MNSEAIFAYEGINIPIHCKTYDKMENIIDRFLGKIEKKEDNLIFSYGGGQLKKEKTFLEQANFYDKIRLKMNIVVNDNDFDNDEKKEMISKDTICSECKENTLIDIKDYFKLNFHGCKNNHNINDMFLYKYDETQKIDLNEIVCDICKKVNKTKDNEFYICYTCKNNICKKCKSIHDKNNKNKNHIIIDYDKKNYICKKHNKPFNKYCKKCNEDICISCENDHKNHEIFDFKKNIIDKNELLVIKDELKKSIDNLKHKINIIIELFQRKLCFLDIYYKISNDIIDNYDMNNKNYYKLINIKNIKNNNEMIIRDINNIINTNNIFEFYKFPNDELSYNNGEIYIGELNNGLKNGKGILYYNKNDIYERRRYEGDFKNNKQEGKGVLLWNNKSIYEGDFKNDKREGKGIKIFYNGDRYDGYWKNDKKEGKGKIYLYNGDIYEGYFKNNQYDGEGEYLYKNGDRYKGAFENNKKEGYGVLSYKNRDRYKGCFKNDKKDGKGEMSYYNGPTKIGFWKEDVYVGSEKKKFFNFWYQ